MGKFSTEGAFYLHIIIISFMLLVFTVLKNFNFEDFRESPDLTKTQVKFIYLFLFISVISMFLMFVRGFFVKTPKLYTRAGFAMLFIVLGVVLIVSMLLYDEVRNLDQKVGAYEIVGILFGSLFAVMGSLAYISIKFPDEFMMKYFRQAVKDEIRKRAAEEQQWRVWNTKQRRVLKQQQLKARKTPRAKKAQVKVKGKAAIKAQAQTKAAGKRGREAKVQEVKMLPPGNIAVVKCSKCQRSLKITSSERPLTIKCPFCEAIGVIKE